MDPIVLDLAKVFIPSVLAFVVGIGITPMLTNYLYANKMWKKKAGKVAPDGSATPIFNSLHKDKEVGTPKMGGVVIWASTFIVVSLLWVLSELTAYSIFDKLVFFSRNQTWIPLTALVLGSLVGLIDDFLEVRGNGDYIAGGLSLKKRLLVVALIALACACWFYFKLGVLTIGFPIVGEITLGYLFIPLFVIVALGIYSGGVIDGIDGLAGGIFATMFAAYAAVAFFQSQIDLAAFCATIVGGTLAFLWFNIPPARFYMSETGTMGLTITLSIVAFMTDSLGKGHGLIALPIIAAPLIATTASDVIQIFSKRFRGKKVFLVAPLHHHFEALGWPGYKVTMRFWIVGVVFAILGIVIALVS
jgi:phospho-N-acetylmuramoyl-pentapeptide-transferase